MRGCKVTAQSGCRRDVKPETFCKPARALQWNTNEAKLTFSMNYSECSCLDPADGPLIPRNLNKQKGTKSDADWAKPRVIK